MASHKLTGLSAGTASGHSVRYEQVNGVVTTAGDLLYATASGTLARLGIGTAGQQLRVNSGATAPAWVSGANVPTAQAVSGLTNVDFTAPVAGPRMVIVGFSGVSTGGTNNYNIQIGPTGGVETSGYLGTSGSCGNAGANVVNAFTVGAGINTGDAAAIVHGFIIFALINEATNLWTYEGGFSRTDTAIAIKSSGAKGLAGTLEKVRVTFGGDTGDAGTVGVQWVY